MQKFRTLYIKHTPRRRNSLSSTQVSPAAGFQFEVLSGLLGMRVVKESWGLLIAVRDSVRPRRIRSRRFANEDGRLKGFRSCSHQRHPLAVYLVMFETR